MGSVFPLAVQLYSVRDALVETPQQAIKALSHIGFTHAEGYDLIQLASIKSLLDEVSISVKSSFILWSHITGRYDLAEAINYPWLPKSYGIEYALEQAKSLGLESVVCGYLLPEERCSIDCFKRLAEDLNRAGESCRAMGIQLLYHNHGFEFESYEGDFIPYHYLIENTDSDSLKFEVDTLWCELAGHPVSDVFDRLGDRLASVHLKTGASVEQPLFDDQAYSFEQQDFHLGTGFVDIPSILKLALDRDLQNLYVEQEYSQDIFSSLERSANFIKNYQSEWLK